MLPFGRMVKYGNIAPVPKKIKKVIAGYDNLYVLYGDGSLYGCGINNYQQLNIDGTATQNNWVLITNGVSNAWAGGYNILYLKEDKFIMHGTNVSLGLGNTTIPLGGVDVTSSFPDISNIKMISIGFDSMHYVSADGTTVYGRGMNTNGSVGSGSTYSQSTFTSVLNNGTNQVIDIFGNVNNTVLLTSNGELRACGTSAYGSIGNETGKWTSFGLKLSGTKIMGGNGYSTLAYTNSGMYHSGWQLNGELGNGLDTNVQVYPFQFNSKTIDSKIDKIAKSSSGSYVNMYSTTEGKIYTTGSFGKNGSTTALNLFTNTLTLINYNPDTVSLYTCTNFSVVYDGNETIAVSGSPTYVPGGVAANRWTTIPLPK